MLEMHLNFHLLDEINNIAWKGLFCVLSDYADKVCAFVLS